MKKNLLKLISALIVIIVFSILYYGFKNELPATILIYVFSGIITLSMAIEMIRALRSGHFGIDILAISAIVTTLIANEYLASQMIIIMLVGGEFLESYASRRAKRELTKLVERAPKIAHVLTTDGDRVDTPVEKIKVGDKILVKTGEIVPIDGELLSDSASLDTSSLTGESLPRSYVKGNKVLSGSINQEESFTLKASEVYKNSQYSQIIKMVEEIEAHPAGFVRMADRYAVPFTIIAYVIAGIAWAVSGEFMRFVEVLVVASPCPLILSAPIAFISGMSKASANGVIIKSGTSIEKLSGIRSIAFDKTGTLSRGEIIVDDVISFDPKYPSKRILSLVAGAEQGSSHIIARSIIKYSENKKISLERIHHIAEHAGMGIDAKKDGKQIIIGNIIHILEHKIPLPKTKNKSRSSIFLSVNRKVVGQITFKDNMRKEARSVIDNLRKMGVDNIIMVTGDTEESAKAAAERVGIEKFYAECLPIDKVDIVGHKLKKPAAFVGDGVNDAPVLAAADVSMALAAYGSTAASDAASVVIMSDDLKKVPYIINTAKRTMTVAKQSVIGGIIVSIILMAIASFGVIPVIMGAILQEVMDVISILSSLRARK